MNPAHPNRLRRLAAVAVAAGALLAPIAAAPAAHAEEPPGVTAPPTHHKPKPKPRPVHVTGARAKLLKAARTFIGVPYRYGGASHRGVDCSGLVIAAAKQAHLHKHLPRRARDLQRIAHRVRHPRPGDLVFWGHPAYHVGIYAGHGRALVARHTGTRVQYQVINWGHPTYGAIL